MVRRGLALIALFVTACGAGSTNSSTATPSASPATTVATVGVADNAKLGKILVDGSGRTLYLFEKDTGTESKCYDACAGYWPPLLTSASPKAGPGVNASLLGTSKRTDGTLMVTYGGHPLYYVVTDHKPGDATGQDVNNFGAPWYVVGPDGKKVGD